MRDGLYGSYWLGFAGGLTKSLLNYLAQSIARLRLASSAISRVLELKCDYVALEDTLFTLNAPLPLTNKKDSEDSQSPNSPSTSGALEDLYGKDASEEQVIAHLKRCSDALWSVLEIFQQNNPLIAAFNHQSTATCSTTMLAKAMLSQESDAKTPGNQLQRPLVILVDRMYDLAGPMRHPLTYSGLVQEVLGIRLNRVSIPKSNTSLTGDANATTGQTTTFDLDEKDEFWRENAGLAFPSATGMKYIFMNRNHFLVFSRFRLFRGVGCSAGPVQGRQGNRDKVNLRGWENPPRHQ